MSKDIQIKRNPQDLMAWEREVIVKKLMSVVDVSNYFEGEDLEKINLLLDSSNVKIEVFEKIQTYKTKRHKSSIGYGNLMTIDNFLDGCKDGWLTDDDGSVDFIDSEGFIMSERGWFPYFHTTKEVVLWRRDNPEVKEVMYYSK